MSRQYWSETLAWATSTSSMIGNTATETVVFPNVTIPANYLQDGRTLRVRAIGTYTSAAAAWLSFGLRWGGVAGTVLCKSSPTTVASSVYGAMWEVDALVSARTNGTNASIMSNGVLRLYSPAQASVATTANGAMTPMTSQGSSTLTIGATSNCDTTADTALSLTATWGTASAGNIVQGFNYTIEAMN